MPPLFVIGAQRNGQRLRSPYCTVDRQFDAAELRLGADKHNSQVSYGQSRTQVVWNRVILPDTSSFQLDNLVGTDPAGYAGQEDGVEGHWVHILAGAAMTTLLGIGAELAAPENRQDGDRVIIAVPIACGTP